MRAGCLLSVSSARETWTRETNKFTEGGALFVDSVEELTFGRAVSTTEKEERSRWEERERRLCV